MAKKNSAKIGTFDVELTKIVNDPRGIEDMLIEVIENDWNERKLEDFGCQLKPFADASDIAEWDSNLIDTYPPLYTAPQKVCDECPRGPCDLTESTGSCGLDYDSYQGRLSLRKACQGCLSQMVDSRKSLDYAIKAFGREHPIDIGPNISIGDLLPSTGITTGLYPKNLGDMERILSYGESQLVKLFQASHFDLGSPTDFEGMILHAGSMLFLAMDVSEAVKISCFDFVTSGKHPVDDLLDFPPVNIAGGLGSIDRNKQVLAFFGDNFLPAWIAVDQLKEKGIAEQIEICGLGSVGHDITRFYDKVHIAAPTMKATKAIRSGFADVLVVTNACIDMDIVDQAKLVETRVILTTPQYNRGLPDCTDDPIDKIVEALSKGAPGVLIRDVDKAAKVAVETVQKVKRGGNYLMSEEKAKQEAKKCKEDCDLCFSICPNSLLINQAMKRVVKEGLAALAEVEKGCYLCQKCQAVCPEKISITDMIVATQEKRIEQDKFLMRGGRGSFSDQEYRQAAFTQTFGNCPGYALLLGCGDAKVQEDLGYMADRFTSHNFFVWTAGCGAGEVGRHYDSEANSFVYQKFGAECQSRNLINCGGCSAQVHLMDNLIRLFHAGSGFSWYANYAQAADHNFQHLGSVVIIWGAMPDRMYTMAAGFARNGTPVIVGPATATGFHWNRYLLGNKYDWTKWWMYDGESVKREVEPTPRSLIFPVETKEEAIAVTSALLSRTSDSRDRRSMVMEEYIDTYLNFFKELPDDWHQFVRSDMELPPKFKVRLLKELSEKHGWEIDRLRILRAKHRDGRMLSIPDFIHSYGLEQGAYMTRLERLKLGSGKALVEALRKESK